MIHCTGVVEKRCKLQARFSLQKENCVRQTKISTKTDRDGLLPAVFRSRLGQKIPVTECLVCRVCVLFSIAKSVKNG